jgi:hypothetical protein
VKYFFGEVGWLGCSLIGLGLSYDIFSAKDIMTRRLGLLQVRTRNTSFLTRTVTPMEIRYFMLILMGSI